MDTLTARTKLGLGISIVIFTVGMTGCAHRTQEQVSAAQAGTEMQKNGIMSQNDYARIRELEHTVSGTHSMSDADLYWTLSLLSNSGNSIARARAFTTLSEIRPVSAAQKAKITPFITPYLSSTNQLDQIGAERVQKSMNTGS